MTFKKKHYVCGDVRTRVKFAWLPVSFVENGTSVTIWLEKVEVREKYQSGYADSGWELLEVLDYTSKPRQKP